MIIRFNQKRTLGVHIKKSKFILGTALEFSMSQYARDLLLFKLVKDYLKCGIVEQKSTRPDGNINTYPKVKA